MQDAAERHPLDEVDQAEVSDDGEEVKVHPPPTAEVMAATIAAAAKAEVNSSLIGTQAPDHFMPNNNLRVLRLTIQVGMGSNLRLRRPKMTSFVVATSYKGPY